MSCRALNGITPTEGYRRALDIPYPEQVNSSLSCGVRDDVRTAAIVVCRMYTYARV